MNEYENKLFLTVGDVSKILNCGRTKAYKIIHELNMELINKGYTGIINGKISKSYFETRVFIK